MKAFLIPTAAALAVTLCFAATESRVSRAAITAVESGINEKFRANSADPYDLLGTARGTYLEGYGVLFTIELQLVVVLPPNPFKPTLSPADLTSIRDRKAKKLPLMKETMRSILVNAASTLEGLPPNEHIAMEAILWNYSWENYRGPRRVFMTAEKQKLLDMRGHPEQAQLASVIEEQER